MESKPMRVVFGETLRELGEAYPELVVLDSDTSSSTQTKLFGDAYPNRFFNCGIAEGNMVGMAGGMAACGLIPVASAFAFLIALRAGDDVRSLVAHNRLNVKLAGGYCGLSDFADGASHQSVSDIGVIRSIPGIVILTPSDIVTTKAAVKAMLDYEGPVYIRLSRDLAGCIHEEAMDFEIGRAYRVKEGMDITIASSGVSLTAALEAARALAQEGIDAEVLDFTTVKPLDAQTLIESVKKTRALITVEEHNIYGGLGSAAAEVLSEQFPVKMKRVGMEDCFGESGSYPELLEKYGISAKRLAEEAEALLNKGEESLLYSKIYGCLLGGLIGDAMGAPTEDLTYQEIEEKFGYVTEFEGSGTDDSAIKLVLCDAVLASGGHVTADEFAEAFMRNKEKYYDLFFVPVKNMFHKVESKLELPVYAGLGNMQSSSSAMSISPMGLINACDPRRAALETYDVAGLIHGGVSTFCRDGACAMAAAVAEAMNPGATVDEVIEASTAYLHKISSAEMLENIHDVMSLARSTGGYERFRELFYQQKLRDIVSDSRETVPCVLALFYLAQGDPVTTIRYAANFGRDADTIGAMAGALSGAYAGVAGLKEKWIKKVEESYGRKQENSKAVKTDVEMPDQRILAKQLMDIVLKRRIEAEAVRLRTEACR